MDPAGNVFEQHPVPQNISSYQFRLVGDMTIKQFFQLAAGAVIALLIYATPLPAFLKWPFIILFVLGGAAFAFLPIQERPLEEWVQAFFRSIYAPTIYKWSKGTTPPKYFQPESPVIQAQQEQMKKETASDAMTKSLQTSGAGFLQNFEDTEKKMLNKFTEVLAHAAETAKVAKEQQLQKTTASAQQNQKPQEPSPIITNLSPVVAPTIMEQPKPQTKMAQTKPKQDVMVPITGRVEVEKQGYQPFGNQSGFQGQTTDISQTLTQSQVAQNINKPQFSPDAAPPMPPTQPNVIVGQIIDANRKIIEGAILEIKDTLNRPLRALKTNKAGHFQIVTPLNNGKYEIIIEKEGYKFNPIEIEITGNIIPPIVITANKEQNIKGGQNA
jgi:hypothetical protein